MVQLVWESAGCVELHVTRKLDLCLSICSLYFNLIPNKPSAKCKARGYFTGIHYEVIEVQGKPVRDRMV